MSVASLSADPNLDKLLGAFTVTFFTFAALFCFSALVLGLAGNLEAGSVFAIASVGSVVMVVGISLVRLLFLWPRLRVEFAETAASLPARRARIEASSHPRPPTPADPLGRMAAVVDRVVAAISMRIEGADGGSIAAAPPPPAPAAAELAEEGRLAPGGAAGPVRVAPARREDDAPGEHEISASAPPMRSGRRSEDLAP